MHFLAGDAFGMGGIGIVYDGPLGAIGTWIVFITIIILSIIGLLTTLKFLFTRKRKKETPEERWLKTGKYK